MEMHSINLPEAGQTTTVNEALVRVTHIMDSVYEELLGTQQAIEKCVQSHMLDEGEMHNIQKLDSATQTVEALATVLKNLIACPAATMSDTVNVATLYDGVKLGEVVQALGGEEQVDRTHQAGEVDLF
ncbi:hypothetical protein DY926_02950 [Komagataeibacter melaceti]|uniref:Uncharacterized protein n=1 Tax=Komagataeibacter melaceti TaxID=2766577 RepID=A0A371Z3E8_9PROT|nr:hypothetical protein [Komagataeibacter melaceti]RFD21022.1 hypothetical protein DY926_02950 [Komagataeibacter melaceti]